MATESDSRQPLVVAVVLTWNDTELTTRCLQSVLANDYPRLKVVLVDNGSIPPRGPELQAQFPTVTLVQNPHNQGFSGGANRGLEAALEMKPDYIQLIGNDATLAPHTVSSLVAECEKRPTVGAASPLLLDPGQPEIVQFYTASVDRNQGIHHHHHVGEVYEPSRFPAVETEFIPCVALLFRVRALRESGLMDESFGTCWEDYDLCLRMRDAGWTFMTVGAATAVHLGSYTTGRISPYIIYYSTRNRLICLRRYSRDLHKPARWLALLRSFWWEIRRYGLRNWKGHAAFIRAFRDYFSGNHFGEALRTKPGRVPGVDDT